MIYVSSSSVKSKTIAESIDTLLKEGFQNIELSGGTEPYAELQNDLERFAKEGVNLMLHNYFPPPEKPFVLNLASLDPEVEEMSMNHAFKALDLSSKLGIEKYAVHAGFLINIPLDQVGKPITEQPLFDRDAAMEKFVQNVESIQNYNEVDLYIENNVVAPFNLKNFKGVNPFFLTHQKEVEALRARLPFKFLLDIAHLKVSCHALELNFEKELHPLIEMTDYIHVSDNNGLSDSNNVFKKDSRLFALMSEHSYINKTLTLEVYDGISAVHDSHEALHSLL